MKQEIKDKMMYIRNKWMYHTMHVKLDDAVDNCMIEAYSLAQEEYASKGMRWVLATPKDFDSGLKHKFFRDTKTKENLSAGAAFSFFKRNCIDLVEILSESPDKENEPPSYRDYINVLKENLEASKRHQDKRVRKLLVETYEDLIAIWEAKASGKIIDKENEPVADERAKEYDPFIEKHLGIIKSKMKDSFIHQHIEAMWGGLEMASVQHFVETGKVNGSFSQRLISLIDNVMKWQVNLAGASTQADRIKELEEQLTLEKGGVESLLRDKKELEAELAEAKEKRLGKMEQ